MAVKRTKKKTEKAKAFETKEEAQHHYEMVIVLRPGDTDSDNEQVVEGITKLIESLGGSLKKVEPWGKKKLAYKIAHLGEAYYALIHFSIGSRRTRELENKLRLNERVLRHMLIVDES